MTLITVHLAEKTKKYSKWIISKGDKVYTTQTENRYRKRALDEIRYLINRTFRLNTSDYMLLGNRKVNGQWISEWMIK